MIKKSLKAQETKPQLYSEVLMVDSEISKSTEKELAQYGISADHIPPNLTSLVVEKYVDMGTNDNYKTVYIRLLEKGMIAGTSGEFWQKMEGRERDLLQVELTKSTKSTNYWVKRTSIVSVLIAAITGYYIVRQAINDLNRNPSSTDTLLQKKAPLLDSMTQFQKGIDSSLRKAVKDSFYKRP